jgi:hypothetical protein
MKYVVVLLALVMMCAVASAAVPPMNEGNTHPSSATWGGTDIYRHEVWSYPGSWNLDGVATYNGGAPGDSKIEIGATVYAWIDMTLAYDQLTYVIGDGLPGSWKTSPANPFSCWGSCGYSIDILMDGPGESDALWPNLTSLTRPERPVAQWGLDYGQGGNIWRGRAFTAPEGVGSVVTFAPWFATAFHGVHWDGMPADGCFLPATTYYGYLYHRVLINDQCRVGSFTGYGYLTGMPIL